MKDTAAIDRINEVASLVDTPGGVEPNLRTHAEPEEGPRLEYLGHRKVARAPSASVIGCGYPLSRDVADQ